MIPDSNLGIPIPAFDNDLFRNAVKLAQQMGTTPDPDKRPKFIRRTSGRTYWRDGVQLATPPRLGRDGQPLDATVEVRTEPDQEITVDCSVTIERVEADEKPVGNFRNTKAVVELLDVEYAKIQDCREMTYNGDRYSYGYEPGVDGMFEVSVHTLIYYCRDES